MVAITQHNLYPINARPGHCSAENACRSVFPVWHVYTEQIFLTRCRNEASRVRIKWMKNSACLKKHKFFFTYPKTISATCPNATCFSGWRDQWQIKVTILRGHSQNVNDHSQNAIAHMMDGGRDARAARHTPGGTSSPVSLREKWASRDGIVPEFAEPFQSACKRGKCQCRWVRGR